jgi:hypothetical protein
LTQLKKWISSKMNTFSTNQILYEGFWWMTRITKIIILNGK